MKINLIIIFYVMSILPALAQKKETKLAGTYELIAVDNILADGSRVHLYGDTPQGLLMLDAEGHYALQIFSQGRQKFVANDKSKGTDEENRAAVKSSNAHFGIYTIDDANGSITFNIQHASFPNLEGTQQKRSFTFMGSTFKYNVPAPTTGGAVTGEVTWRKVN